MLSSLILIVTVVILVHLLIFGFQRKFGTQRLVLRYSVWWANLRRRCRHLDYLVWLIGDFLMDAGEVLKKGAPDIINQLSPDDLVIEILRRNGMSAATNRSRALEKPSPKLGVGTCADTRTPAKRILQIFHGQADVLATTGSILTPFKVQQIAFLCEAHNLLVWLQIAPHTDCGALKHCGDSGTMRDRYPLVTKRIANAGPLLGFELLLENEEIKSAVCNGTRKFLLARLDTRTEQLTVTHELAVKDGKVVVQVAQYPDFTFTPVWHRHNPQEAELISNC